MSKKSDYITLRFDDSKFPAVLFKGRIGRPQFIFSFVVFSVIKFIFQEGFSAFQTYEQSQSIFVELLTLLIALIVILLFFMLYISVFSKRFHDIGKSGYWGILGIIPLVNIVVFVILVFIKGTKGSNKYGKPPSTFFI